MTEHPITPPPNLVRQWIDEPQYMTEDQLGKRMYMISLNEVKFREIISKASQYGADQELEACCAEMDGWGDIHYSSGWKFSKDLRYHRRPNPPSLKEQALGALGRFNTNTHTRADEMTQDFDLIRLALEALDD